MAVLLEHERTYGAVDLIVGRQGTAHRDGG